MKLAGQGTIRQPVIEIIHNPTDAVSKTLRTGSEKINKIRDS